MRIQSPWFPARWKDRILNIHPSLLPSFPGLHVQQQAIDAGARISGCTVHFVTPELDSGPIIAQAADSKEEYFSGLTFPSGTALTARKYMQTYGVTEEDLAHTSVKNHYYGARNARALFRKEITLDKALAIRPDVFEALYNKGVALAQLGRNAEAVSSFDRALALKDDRR